MGADVSQHAAGADRRAFMRRQPLFEGLDEADLDQLEALSGTVEVPAGHVLLREGDDGSDMFIVMEGVLEVRRRHPDGAYAVLGERGPGEVVGEMALLAGEARTATVVASTKARLLRIDREALDALFRCSHAAPLTIVATVLRRFRSAEAMLVHQEKLASLGTMAAGLAHELNNPAAAIARASGHMGDAWRTWRDACEALLVQPLDGPHVEALRELSEALAQAGAATPGAAAALDRADRETALQQALAALGAPEPWGLAASFAASGWDRADLEARLAPFPAPQRPRVARYLAAAMDVHDLLRETAAGAAAISEIVRSVRSYTYLDHAALEPVDVRQGLEDTLVILRHRMRDAVRVERDYPEELPLVQARGSELNQVWTNLVGNAIDAMEGRGTLRVSVRARHGEVRVRICDDGPGIPPEVRHRIFDPFFTTKGVGLGNGLGLHLVNGIVRAHQGHVRVESEPGDTCFEVCLPAEGAEGPAS